MRRVSSLGSAASLRSLAPLLLTLGCWSAQDTSHFKRTDLAASVAGAGGGSPTAAQSGTDSGAQSNAEGAASGANGALGGSLNAGGADVGGGGNVSAGLAGQPAEAAALESCDMLEGAVTSQQNHHCYRVALDELDFAAALAACRDAGGHLVSIGDQAENDFVRDLHDGEHWLGATDGRASSASGAGTYAWVNEEPWQYTAWEDGQPNAHATDCPGLDGGADCYEHCAFQSDSGDWNDRSCWHIIASVCEWDLQNAPDAAGP
jgi:hypothetical protein